MKYFFLSDSWTTGRVWEFGGEWNTRSRRRGPHLQKQSLCIQENGETLWLFQAEDDILMLEVKPKATAQGTEATIGQVVLKRLLTAEQVIERLCAGGHHHDSLHPPAQRSVLNERDEQLVPETAAASSQL